MSGSLQPSRQIASGDVTGALGFTPLGSIAGLDISTAVATPSGGTATSLAVIAAEAAAGSAAATAAASAAATAAAALPKAGGTMTGALVLSTSSPTSALQAASKGYVDSAVAGVSGSSAGCVLITGSTMTGPLILSADPTSALQAATKEYVDSSASAAVSAAATSAAASYVALGGSTMTGLLTLSGAPTASLHAATKSYVDAAIAGVSGGGGGVTAAEIGETGTLGFTRPSVSLFSAYQMATAPSGITLTDMGDSFLMNVSQTSSSPSGLWSCSAYLKTQGLGSANTLIGVFELDGPGVTSYDLLGLCLWNASTNTGEVLGIQGYGNQLLHGNLGSVSAGTVSSAWASGSALTSPSTLLLSTMPRVYIKITNCNLSSSGTRTISVSQNGRDWVVRASYTPATLATTHTGIFIQSSTLSSNYGGNHLRLLGFVES